MIEPSWRSNKFPMTATPAGPAPTTTAAHFRVAMLGGDLEDRRKSGKANKGLKRFKGVE